MANAARAVFIEPASNRAPPPKRPRGPAKVVRLNRASRAAHVFSEIAKAHITHPLPDQLQLAEEDLRAALDELLTMKVEPVLPVVYPPKRPLPSLKERCFVLGSLWGFWGLMIFQTLQHFGVL